MVSQVGSYPKHHPRAVIFALFCLEVGQLLYQVLLVLSTKYREQVIVEWLSFTVLAVALDTAKGTGPGVASNI